MNNSNLPPILNTKEYQSLVDKYNTICYSDELIWEVEHLGYTAICEEAYKELTVN